MNDSIYHIVDSVSLASDTLVNPVGAASVLIEHPVELEWLVRPIYFDNIPHLGLLLLCLVVITLFLLARYRKANLFTLRNFFTIHDRSMAYEPETREWWGNVLMWVVTFCSYAIYLMLLLSIYSDQVLISDVRLGLIAIVAIGIYLLVHYLLFKLLNYIFSNAGSGNAYIQAYYTVIVTIGMLLLPISICLVYLPETSYSLLLIISYIVVGLGLLLLCFKSIQLFCRKIISIFYIILYFCTLEILPLLLVWKVVNFWVS